MAHLMLFYQLQRVKRDINARTAKEFTFSTKKKHIEDCITKTQKRYTSIFDQLKKQEDMWNNQMMNYCNMQTGAYSNNPSDMSGTSAALTAIMLEICTKTGIKLKQDEEPKTIANQQTFQNIQAYYQQYGSMPRQGDTEETRGNCYRVKSDGSIDTSSDPICSYQDLQIYQASQYQAQQSQAMKKNYFAQLASTYKQNIADYFQAIKEQLEGEQDEALDDLNYEQDMIEADETANKARLEELKEEKQNIQQELSENIKDDAPKFGLQ